MQLTFRVVNCLWQVLQAYHKFIFGIQLINDFFSSFWNSLFLITVEINLSAEELAYGPQREDIFVKEHTCKSVVPPTASRGPNCRLHVPCIMCFLNNDVHVTEYQLMTSIGWTDFIVEITRGASLGLFLQKQFDDSASGISSSKPKCGNALAS